MIDYQKITNDIKDLKGKKDVLILSIQNDIDNIKKTIADYYHGLGEKVYETYVNNSFDITAHAEVFELITSNKESIASKEKKMGEISERYDEEIDLLEKLINDMPKPQVIEDTPMPQVVENTPKPQSKEFCISCGSPFTRGVDIFCINCGKKH